MDSLIEVVVTEKVLEKHPARNWGYSYLRLVAHASFTFVVDHSMF